MRLAIRRAKEDDPRMGVSRGDLILVELDYDWDPDKVVVLSKLTRGSSPGMSAYKESIDRVSPKELREYLEG